MGVALPSVVDKNCCISQSDSNLLLAGGGGGGWGWGSGGGGSGGDGHGPNLGNPGEPQLTMRELDCPSDDEGQLVRRKKDGKRKGSSKRGATRLATA